MAATHAVRAIKFECPHCRATVEVEPTSLGEVVTCPSPDCGLPFEAVAPAGHALDPVSQRTPAANGEEVQHADENLETPVFEVHPAMFRSRPLTFLALWAVAIVGAVAVLGSLVGWGLEWAAAGAVFWTGVVLLVLGGGTLLVWWVRVIDETLTVTTVRTIHRRGILSKTTSEVLHDDVRNLQLDQSFVGRLLGVGTVALSSSGQDELEIVARGIPRPERVVEVIRKHQHNG